MKVSTGWRPSQQETGGLDHLGTQGPCQLIYQQLIPGITNVTDRARYYALYPWVIWSFDQRYRDANAERFVEIFRTADFLLTLVAERHGRTRGEPEFLHGAGMAGRSKLPLAFDRLTSTGKLNLGEFAMRSAGPTRYFKSRLGGLGQYYLGTLVELNILNVREKGRVRYSREVGLPLAQAVEAGCGGISDHFWAVVTEGVVTADDLDRLSAFCPCGLRPGSEEHALLTSLLMAADEEEGVSGEQRRNSIALILDLAEHAKGPDGQHPSFHTGVFRAAVYSGELHKGRPWCVPERLRETRRAWEVYQANELVSIACLSLFSSAVEEIASATPPYSTIEELAASMAEYVNARRAPDLGEQLSFHRYFHLLQARSPRQSEWQHADHELSLAAVLLDYMPTDLDTRGWLVPAPTAFDLLLLVAHRMEGWGRPYEGLSVSTEDLDRSPINLGTVRERVEAWEHRSLHEAVSDLIIWCLNTHLSVSLRKLRHTSQLAFRFRPGERGLERTSSTPAPSQTTPRFSTTTQMLLDMGALQALTESRWGGVSLTAVGLSWLEGTRD